MYDHLKDKSVLITGGTGSVGSNIARFLLAETTVSKVIIFSRDEHKQHQMAQEIRDPRVRFFLGDVRDRDRLKRAFHNVDIVIHAAALKHVPALEYNPIEAVKTNIYGTQNVIDAAVDEGVERVLFISSDKAVEPINLYGATKLCAEKLIISANAYSPTRTRFSVVRYGNVLGTRGSVVETLLKTRVSGRATITHTDMTRFWITLRESLDLVMFALSQMEGGEIFVPRAHSMKLVDLFNVIAPDAEQEVIGLRPGEKLHELLVSAHEAPRAIEIGNYYVILPEFRWMNTDMYRKYHDQGTPQIIGFVFASDTNTRWLAPDDLRAIIAELEKMK